MTFHQAVVIVASLGTKNYISRWYSLDVNSADLDDNLGKAVRFTLNAFFTLNSLGSNYL